jgi:hypothetical protein
VLDKICSGLLSDVSPLPNHCFPLGRSCYFPSSVEHLTAFITADLQRAHPCEKSIKLFHPSVCIPTTLENRKKIFTKSDVVNFYKKSETLATTSHETPRFYAHPQLLLTFGPHASRTKNYALPLKPRVLNIDIWNYM